MLKCLTNSKTLEIEEKIKIFKSNFCPKIPNKFNEGELMFECKLLEKPRGCSAR